MFHRFGETLNLAPLLQEKTQLTSAPSGQEAKVDLVHNCLSGIGQRFG